MQARNTRLVSSFRQSAPYVNAHRGKTFIIMLGGECIAHPNFFNIVNDIALLKTLGIKIVLVYGARPQIESALKAQGIQSQFHQQQRITTDETFELIKQVVGRLQFEINAQLSQGLVNTPMQGASINVISGNFVTAQPIGVRDGIDFHYTGKVRRIDTQGIKDQLAQNSIVLISIVGYSVTGESFNLSAEEVATQLAIRLKADKMIGFCSENGVLNQDGNVISEMLPSQAQRRLNELESAGEIMTGTAIYLRAAIASCKAGVPRSHLVSYQQDGSLIQELFSRDGIGTQIVMERAEQLRSASIEDIGGIVDLIRPLEEQRLLVRRSREQLEMEIDKFTVVERDGLVIGCAALYPAQDGISAEMACVATHPEYRKASRGDALVNEISRRARDLGISKLFVLTTSSIHWFRERGFVPMSIEQLPMEKQALYNFQRNSKILIKTL
ncbi:amino-acid N-acetyltransferase [Psychrobium sp. 1_MG-2023]|uniref:amino-acid N-acetyltransferase n=1 Tax=Psychrobium sp. 1_MG-2023 TaxID=3062624 RepID=UPI000C3383B7|nr:amino-acid N-acetyltransferase [Psychrobium sp. 1_MG-2023]MDP2561758.1 amino-acid N-acetyltransferase [Psychrobium sp. 1_MG-2023]PKF59755.1 amino-acid N-acetyltransferase [Alteromonadales bacterium alter-6D02]